ncbi:MgtC/SapB family protein [Noviherbaspirillum saxi]|uniref:Protein MgtC n=1 Tax=Noviherbaspirillum saxi TaxID=2320863 RepID=A0A3A3FSL0_9BURK|nr:MgtC/SapB family protein [Noviherbaspirillum saxi]RJF99152.1 MgtC/SapB family protein [Noviherbaspirillum saxi]
MQEAWMTVWTTLQAEFSDLPDLAEFTRVSARLIVALSLGAVLGYEREQWGTGAGLRTHMLVALGASLFVLVPLQAGMEISDLSRVLQGLISGIGFLGAGAIIKLSRDREIRGLTTAASVWVTAAIGVSAGMGREATAVLCTFLALCILGLSHQKKTATDKG